MTVAAAMGARVIAFSACANGSPRSEAASCAMAGRACASDHTFPEGRVAPLRADSRPRRRRSGHGPGLSRPCSKNRRISVVGRARDGRELSTFCFKPMPDVPRHGHRDARGHRPRGRSAGQKALPGTHIPILTTFARAGYLPPGPSTQAPRLSAQDAPARKLADAVQRVHED